MFKINLSIFRKENTMHYKIYYSQNIELIE